MENKENEILEEKDTTALVETQNYSISDFSKIGRRSNTITEVFTNITDNKLMFNLENNVDTMLNDCEGEIIRVKYLLIKRYEKPLKEPIFNEETGEIIKDKEFTMSCCLVDDNGKSYATGSKSFTIQMMRYLQMNANLDNSFKDFEIKITKKQINTGNKVLSFELV